MQDDKIILLEGVDSLTVPELVQACHARGIRTVDVSYDRLRFELQQWLDLHLKNEVPSTLLILARALMMTSTTDVQEKKTEEVLRDALQALPQQVVQEAEIRLSEAEGKSDFKKKLELLESEERSIEEELKKTEKEQQQKPKK
jgi:LETM1 and EF-hand domain-containing protein 1